MKKLLAVLLVCAVVAGWAMARNVDSAAPTKVVSLYSGDIITEYDHSKTYMHFDMPDLNLQPGETIASAILHITATYAFGSPSVSAYTFTETGWSWDVTPVATMNGYSLGSSLDTETVASAQEYQFDITGNASQGFIKLAADGATAFSVALKPSGTRATPTYANNGIVTGLAFVDQAGWDKDTAYIRVVITESVPVVPTDTLTEENGTKEIPRQSFATGGSFGF